MEEAQTLISFGTINEFKQFCINSKNYPTLSIYGKKHSNMRGEFFHEVTGSITMHGTDIVFKISEPLVLKTKLNYQEEGYQFSEIFTN